MTSTEDSDYYYGEDNISGTNYDWGVYNRISNGGNVANTWRTLTKDEWAFLFNTRYTSSGIRYAKAQVNGMNGIILVPDDWNVTTYSLNNTNESNASYTSNVMSEMVWTNTFECAGAVFLPTAGERYGVSIGDVGSYGKYWSSSYDWVYYAYLVRLSDSELIVHGGDDGSYWHESYRCYGHSVRLVCSVD